MKVFNKLKSIAAAALLGVASLGMATTANALPYISGSLQIGGPVINSLTDTSKVTFTTDLSGTTTGWVIAHGTADLSGFTGGEAVTLSNTDFGPTIADAPIWTGTDGGGKTFSLTLTTLVEAVANSTGGLLYFKALGELIGTGFEVTTGVFEYSAQGTGSFSSSTVVPLPASILLLGGGLVAFGAVARRRNKKIDLAA